MDKSDYKIWYTKGKGPGGQHKNKVESCVHILHIPTAITVMVDGRNRHQNERLAWKEIKQRLKNLKEEKAAAVKKSKRDDAIHNTPIIRTYDFKSGIVKDHRTGKKASLKEVLIKGNIDLLGDVHMYGIDKGV